MGQDEKEFDMLVLCVEVLEQQSFKNSNLGVEVRPCFFPCLISGSYSVTKPLSEIIFNEV